MAKTTKTKKKPKAKRASKTAAKKKAAAPKKPKSSKGKARAKAQGAKKTAKKAAEPKASKPKPPALVKRPKSRARLRKLDKKQTEAIREALTQMQTELQAELKEIEEAANMSQSEASGEVGYDEDYADAGTFTFEREKDLSIANNVQDLLDKVGRSLRKLDAGSYGVCESCGNPIEAARLKALPHVLLCKSCKTAEELR